MYICWLCAEPFDSEHKLKLHRAHSHSWTQVRTYDYECFICDKQFGTGYGLLSHWKQLGHPLEYFPEDVDTSRSEQWRQRLSESQKGREGALKGVTGEDHPMYGVDVERTDEQKQKLSEAMMGENNPNYIHGESGDGYPPEFREAREKVIERDEVCQDCGTADDILDVHHKDRNRENNSLDNLVLLCRPCHQRRHATAR